MSDQANIRQQSELQAGQLGAPYGIARPGLDGLYRQHPEFREATLYTTAPPNHEALIAAAVNALNKAVNGAEIAGWAVAVTLHPLDPDEASSSPHRLVRVSMNREI